MHFDFLTLFPRIFDSYFNESMLKRAREQKKVVFRAHNIRDYARDKHQVVDDRPYGGGAGMVMKIEPILEALKDVVGEKELFLRVKQKKKNSKIRILLTDPDGTPFDQSEALRLSRYSRLVVVCGHYEGIDARVEKIVDEKISIGNYVLTGGELPAMIIADAITRLVPGVLGNPQSLADISHYSYKKRRKSHFDYPNYTRPEVFSPDGILQWKVPKVLLSGDHGRIEEWRKRFMV